jgi:Amt family ammonium transporter
MASKRLQVLSLALAMVSLSPLVATTALADGAAAAPASSAVSAADTVWVLLGAALVMLMTPGLAFFYGGLVRRKNVLSILMQCFMALCIVSLQWVFCGYSLAFGPDVGGVIGGLDWMGLKGLGVTPSAYAPSVPHLAFVLFQMMFAVVTPGLIVGAFAERMRFASFCLFSLLWATLVYDPVAHWMWGRGGFLGVSGGAGAVDFAGGVVVTGRSSRAAHGEGDSLGDRQQRRWTGPAERHRGGIPQPQGGRQPPTQGET